MRLRIELKARIVFPGLVLFSLLQACDDSGGSQPRVDASTFVPVQGTGGLVVSGGMVGTGGSSFTGGSPMAGGTWSTGGNWSTGGAVATGGVPAVGGAGMDAGLVRLDGGVDLGKPDTVAIDAGREVSRDTGLDSGRDSTPDLTRDAPSSTDGPAGSVLDPATGLATCPVNSGTTPLPAPGGISWTLTKAASPTAAEQDAYNRITPAMNTAICLYSAYTQLTKKIGVVYNAGIPTAEGSTDGASASSYIGFGSTASMNYITAMHEMSHNFGVGSTAFNNRCVNGVFNGTNATAELRAITGGASDVVKCGGSHFWPYGLNYTTEWKDNTEGKNHCRMVLAIRKDLGL